MSLCLCLCLCLSVCVFIYFYIYATDTLSAFHLKSSLEKLLGNKTLKKIKANTTMINDMMVHTWGYHLQVD